MSRHDRRFAGVTLAAALAMPLLLAALGRPKRGTLLGMPYSFERPTRASVRRSIWDAGSRQMFIPKLYGWGYSVNLHEVARRLGVLAA